MIDKICPVCKTAIKKSDKTFIKCLTCECVISDQAEFDSKFGYEWVKEIVDAQDAKS
jgi:hypothetical protein|tara:strand:+ start:37 stop:207 length:171 start_codon:yes stop_codon:yes gene_type:complete